MLDINTIIGYTHSLGVKMMNVFKNDVELAEFLEILADLSLEAETFEVALAALRLQTELKNLYGDNFL
jgi:hypothetical protein